MMMATSKLIGMSIFGIGKGTEQINNSAKEIRSPVPKARKDFSVSQRVNVFAAG